jgi:formylglycine-generating enzyme required for sulfatase activity
MGSFRIVALGLLAGILACSQAPDTTVPARAPAALKTTTNTFEMKLVLIPAGEFLMGSPESDTDASADEKPQHRVRITRPYYLGATEVTRGQYQAVTGANPSQFQGSDDLPVDNVSWLDAINYCNALSGKEGLTPFYRVEGETVEVPDWNATGYRLPTEAEWEYACRAGSTTRYSFGDDATGLGAFAWYVGNSRTTLNVRRSQPVGLKRPNAWGLYDMHGNAEEWCWDGYEADYHSKKPPAADPPGPSQAASRVNRGGGWRFSPQRCRSAFRIGHAPGYRSALLGFRVSRVPSGE